MFLESTHNHCDNIDVDIDVAFPLKTWPAEESWTTKKLDLVCSRFGLVRDNLQLRETRCQPDYL